MSSPIGDINLEDAILVENFSDGIKRYTFRITDENPLSFTNVVLRETLEGETSGYLITYWPNSAYLIENNGQVNIRDYTGYIVFSYLDGESYYVLNYLDGRNNFYFHPNLKNENGKINCAGGNGSGASGSGLNSSSSPNDNYEGYELIYVYYAGATPGSGSIPDYEYKIYAPPVLANNRLACVGDGNPESTTCTDDTSSDAAFEACTIPVGVLVEEIDLIELIIELAQVVNCEDLMNLHGEDRSNQWDFYNENYGKAKEEIINQRPNRSITDTNSQPGGPNIRYIEDPLNPNIIIDLRHMLVIGEYGRSIGESLELVQWLMRQESAFDNQDYYSNELGYLFYSNYGEAIEYNPEGIVDYLISFLNDESLRNSNCNPENCKF